MSGLCSGKLLLPMRLFFYVLFSPCCGCVVVKTGGGVSIGSIYLKNEICYVFYVVAGQIPENFARGKFL